MQKNNIKVLRKIIYAVESGGQVYGGQNYAAFVGAGANCSNEKAITIGAGQWYAGEAKKLLQKIQRANPAQFKKLDNQGIESDLLKKNWSTYAIAATSAKAKCIVAIINSTLGRKCQDELMDEQITEYAASIAKTYGSMPDTAMMECINIIHQGGSAALKRILAKTAKSYTAKSIYAALNTDPADPRTNQVGDYVTRQKKVYEYITKYASDTATGATTSTETKKEETTVNKLQEHTKLGNYYANNGGTKPYLEKKSNAYLDDFTRNAGSKNYTKFARDVNNWGQPGCQGQPWCAVYQFWKLVKVFGLTKALQIMGGGFYNCQSVTRHAKQKGTWHSTPKKGALIIFRNGSHIGSVNSFDSTYVYTNEGNTSSVAGVVANGGACRNKKYKLTDSAIDGYVWIDYGTAADQESTETAVQLSKTPKWVGMVNTAKLYVRSWPGKENPTIKKYPYLAQHNLIDVCDTIKAADGSTWYYVRIVNKYYGFVAARYITRV